MSWHWDKHDREYRFHTFRIVIVNAGNSQDILCRNIYS